MEAPVNIDFHVSVVSENNSPPKMEILKSATQRAVQMLARVGNLVFNEILTSVSFEASSFHSPSGAFSSTHLKVSVSWQ